MKGLKVAAISLSATLGIVIVGTIFMITNTSESYADVGINSDVTEMLAVRDSEYSVEIPEQSISEETKAQIDENTERLMHADDESVTEVVEPEPVYYEESYYSDNSNYYQDPQSFDWSNYSTYHPTDGLTPEGGINFYDNGSGERLETAYSSNVLHHYRTNEWTVDEEGFYHDSEGRYVVAASDLEQGTVFETSKGEAIVLDCGCDPGVTDFYVNW